jgi:hypothetical protein
MAMTVVEVYDLDESADEATAVRILCEAKGLDEHSAAGSFSQLFWHKRPFTVKFSASEQAEQFRDRLGACGYQSRTLPADPSSSSR